jgi:NADPH:quinone reductase-like Zn-dependent oxidoreductase
MTNRIWQLIPEGNAYRLEPGSREIPVPAADEVLIRVHAVSLNYRDLSNRKNLAGRNVAGKIPTSDGAGEIVAVGQNVTTFRVGDRVAGCFFRTWSSGRFEMRHHQQDLGGSTDGMLAEYVTLPATGVVPLPPHLNYAEGATLPCAGVTAWSALFPRGGLQPGETVLVLGTGGVSTFALQLATAAGARVIVTSSSDDKLQQARAMGAWQTINYRTSAAWEKEVWALTEKRGVDHVIEVGGPGTLEKSMACVAAGGSIALIGVLTGFGPTSASLFPLIARNIRLNGIYVGSHADFCALNAYLEQHQLHPVIDRRFPFHDAVAAYTHLESATHFGKVVIEVCDNPMVTR